MSRIPVINAVPESDEEELLGLAPASNAPGPGSPRVGTAESVSSVVSGEPKSRVKGTLRLIEDRNHRANASRAASAGRGARTARGAAAHVTNGAAPDMSGGPATSGTKHIEWVAFVPSHRACSMLMAVQIKHSPHTWS
jgi:hypothetical protein